MKLNPECINDVLMTVEETVTYFEKFQYVVDGNVPKRLQKYSHDEIVYHIQHCKRSDYLEDCEILGNGAIIFVNDLSPSGHKHLADLRENTIIGQSKVMVKEIKRESTRKTLLFAFSKIPELLTYFKELIFH